MSATSPEAAARAIGQGRFFWYELGTPDLEASKAFYTAALGWRAEAYQGGGAYWVWMAEGAGIGGAFQEPVERPHWVGYVCVEDVDGALARVPQLGGRQVVPPTDIPGIGRYGVLADPQGAVIAVMRPIGEDRPAEPMKRGHVSWNELNTTDSAAALEFYGSLFGWQPTTTMDMGEYGQYRVFRQAGAAEQEWLGGMSDMAKHVGVPAHWLYYVNVDNVEAALQRIGAAGGKVLYGPMDVPGGRAAQCQDPQGGVFAIFAQEPPA